MIMRGVQQALQKQCILGILLPSRNLQMKSEDAFPGGASPGQVQLVRGNARQIGELLPVKTCCI